MWMALAAPSQITPHALLAFGLDFRSFELYTAASPKQSSFRPNAHGSTSNPAYHTVTHTSKPNFTGYIQKSFVSPSFLIYFNIVTKGWPTCIISFIICTIFIACQHAQLAQATDWKDSSTKWSIELRSSSDLRRIPSRARNSTANW